MKNQHSEPKKPSLLEEARRVVYSTYLRRSPVEHLDTCWYMLHGMMLATCCRDITVSHCDFEELRGLMSDCMAFQSALFVGLTARP